MTDRNADRTPRSNILPRVAPLVSVVTVVYNRPDGLAETMDNVLKQDYPNLDYVVIDGGSTDETLAVIKARAGRLSTWITETDSGIYDAINKGIMRCKGDFYNVAPRRRQVQPKLH